MGAEVMEEKSCATRLRIRIKPLTKKTLPAATAAAAAAAERSTCLECGKSFPSDKALFGHLRCHPERDYRGAAPPRVAKDRKPPSPSPPRALVKRPTGKRGRKELDFSSEDDGGGDDQVAAAAAAILTYIAAGKKLPRSDFDELDEYVAAISSCRRSKKARVEDLATASLDFASSSSSVLTAKDRRRYFCTVCFKTFSSHRALGGHRASHNKTEKTNNSTTDGKEAENDSPAAAATEHRCKSCNLIFSSGQALGGHQRRHLNEAAAQEQATHLSATSQPCDGRASRGAPSPSEAVNDAAPARTGRSEIDLNQMPCLESDES